MIVLDPTHQETAISTGSLTVALNAQREMCVLAKAGGIPLQVDEIVKVVNIGIDVVREMSAEVEAALQKDEAVRIINVV